MTEVLLHDVTHHGQWGREGDSTGVLRPLRMGPRCCSHQHPSSRPGTHLLEEAKGGQAISTT